jgi:hypothetical protein
MRRGWGWHCRSLYEEAKVAIANDTQIKLSAPASLSQIIASSGDAGVGIGHDLDLLG